jgi:hypothetical protein
MIAFLKSRGIKIWEITQDETYRFPQTQMSNEDREKFLANDKAINFLLQSLCEAEFNRVQDFEDLAHKICRP